MTPNPFLGVTLHSVGGLAAGSFYIPFRKVSHWAWESYCLVQGVLAWVVMPSLVAVLTVPDLWAVEQAANFKVRAAAAAWQDLRRLKAGEERDDKRRKLLKEVGQALDTLERLVQTGKSIERLNLLGGAFKRQVYILETREERQKALESMMNTYRGAHELDREDPYAFTNYALARVLLARIRKPRGATWKQTLVRPPTCARQSRNWSNS